MFRVWDYWSFEIIQGLRLLKVWDYLGFEIIQYLRLFKILEYSGFEIIQVWDYLEFEQGWQVFARADKTSGKNW